MSQDQPRSSESIHPELSSELLEKSKSISNAPEALADSVQSPMRENSRSVIGNQQSSKRTLLEDEILPQTLLRLVGEAFIAAQVTLKQQSIKALRGTIHCLETAVERLQAAPAPKRKAPAINVAPENLPSRSKSNTGRLAPIATNALRENRQTLWRRLWRSWRVRLRQLRDRLPTSFNRSVSDRALTGAIAGIMAIVLWATASLLPDQRTSTTVVTLPVVIVTPSPEPTPAPTPIPPIVQAPETPKPVEISPAPMKPLPPSPPLKLTPEQTLIARIQDQVAAISNQYASDLVQSVQANFRGSRLIVNISDGWYGLSRSQQDKLAGELLQRTQTLDFSKLEMVDSAGTLLARSPIVGANIILLKRTNGSEQQAKGSAG